MVEECTDDRIPQEQAAEILDSVIRVRKNYEQFEKPGDVNALIRLFPCLQLSEGYILDYEQVQEGEVVTRIRPFARKKEEEDGEPLLLDFLSPDMEGLTDQDVENLYQVLIYEKTPRGLFAYAFFALELWSTRASWHEAEWLASTPVFMQQHLKKW